MRIDYNGSKLTYDGTNGGVRALGPLLGLREKAKAEREEAAVFPRAGRLSAHERRLTADRKDKAIAAGESSVALEMVELGLDAAALCKKYNSYLSLERLSKMFGQQSPLLLEYFQRFCVVPPAFVGLDAQSKINGQSVAFIDFRDQFLPCLRDLLFLWPQDFLPGVRPQVQGLITNIGEFVARVESAPEKEYLIPSNFLGCNTLMLRYQKALLEELGVVQRWREEDPLREESNLFSALRFSEEIVLRREATVEQSEQILVFFREEQCTNTGFYYRIRSHKSFLDNDARGLLQSFVQGAEARVRNAHVPALFPLPNILPIYRQMLLEKIQPQALEAIVVEVMKASVACLAVCDKEGMVDGLPTAEHKIALEFYKFLEVLERQFLVASTDRRDFDRYLAGFIKKASSWFSVGLKPSAEIDFFSIMAAEKSPNGYSDYVKKILFFPVSQDKLINVFAHLQECPALREEELLSFLTVYLDQVRGVLGAEYIFFSEVVFDSYRGRLGEECFKKTFTYLIANSDDEAKKVVWQNKLTSSAIVAPAFFGAGRASQNLSLSFIDESDFSRRVKSAQAGIDTSLANTRHLFRLMSEHIATAIQEGRWSWLRDYYAYQVRVYEQLKKHGYNDEDRDKYVRVLLEAAACTVVSAPSLNVFDELRVVLGEERSLVGRLSIGSVGLHQIVSSFSEKFSAEMTPRQFLDIFVEFAEKSKNKLGNDYSLFVKGVGHLYVVFALTMDDPFQFFLGSFGRFAKGELSADDFKQSFLALVGEKADQACSFLGDKPAQRGRLSSTR